MIAPVVKKCRLLALRDVKIAVSVNDLGQI